MFHTIETTAMEYLISELALNYMNQKNIWYQISVKSCIFIEKLYQHRKPYKLAETIFISPLGAKEEKWW